MPARVTCAALSCAVALSLGAAPVAAARHQKKAPAGAGAAQLTISPLVVNLTLAPGASTTTSVSVTASGSAPLDVEFQHADFGFSPDSYAVTVIEDVAKKTVPFSTRGWFSTPRARYHIPAGQTVQVPVKVNVPANATGGMHLGAAFFRTAAAPGTDASGTQVMTSARSGPLLFVNVLGGHEPRPYLQDLRVGRILTHGPIRPHVVAESHGDSYLQVSGIATLTGGGHTWKATLPSRYVVPKLPRRLTTEDGTSPVLGAKHLAPGRYRLHVHVTAEPGGQDLDRTATFWVVPAWVWVVLALGLAALVAAAAIVVVRIRRARAWAALVDDDLDDDEEE